MSLRTPLSEAKGLGSAKGRCWTLVVTKINRHRAYSFGNLVSIRSSNVR